MKYTYLIIFLAVFIPFAAFAADISVQQPFDTIHIGDEFTVSVSLDPQGVSANAFEGSLELSSNLAVMDERLNDSIVPLWVEEPRAIGSRVSFSGIIPGGFQGSVSTEWKGYRAGTVFTLVLKAIKAGTASVSFASSTALYANDGVGTEIPLRALGAFFHVLPEIASHSAPAISIDTIPPEAFTPLITSGEPFGLSSDVVVFHTEDKQSGILYYEIAKTDALIDDAGVASLPFERAESPYPLSSTDKGKYIYVRAVDKYGNSVIGKLAPEGGVPAGKHSSILLIGLVLLIGAGGYIFYRRSYVS